MFVMTIGHIFLNNFVNFYLILGVVVRNIISIIEPSIWINFGMRVIS